MTNTARKTILGISRKKSVLLKQFFEKIVSVLSLRIRIADSSTAHKDLSILATTSASYYQYQWPSSSHN